MKKNIIFVTTIILAILLLTQIKPKITNFDECVAAGNPVMESYPRQCRDPTTDKTFTEIIEDNWRLDNINLMQHRTEKFYGCFGCSPAGKDPALCIDPIIEMEIVEETPDRYCNSDFEIIEKKTYCEEEQRSVDACIEIYDPVCGWDDPEIIQCFAYPCASDYENSCKACTNPNVLYYTKGKCPKI